MVMSKRTIKRRRRENKTDYKLRLNLLKSGEKRIVIRTTNKYFIASAVESREAQDFVLKSVTSKDLIKNSWDAKSGGSLKSIPAGYLTGRLLAKELGKGKYIIDLGMARTSKGCRVFSAVKGLIDGGLEINAKDSVFPSEDRLAGEHLKPELKQMIAGVLAKL
ncbi:50S ribosomal protein L18 [archaeon]|jgi:large subunit ribosomal protein L18|nr:50S ribosomal protein L18 [archaeon]MBT6182787.1 50S ribosomal protein L18 [archaeon]MBT6606123.1 50S ribosomal protein L18 [archaeon]MBT7252037.1 50S ribosomal protein L18 [archaeon]MBT7661014.1 50S ribosomal protein L18 [archaeon]